LSVVAIGRVTILAISRVSALKIVHRHDDSGWLAGYSSI